MYRLWVVLRLVPWGGILADKTALDFRDFSGTEALLVKVDDAKEKKPYLILTPICSLSVILFQGRPFFLCRGGLLNPSRTVTTGGVCGGVNCPF